MTSSRTLRLGTMAALAALLVGATTTAVSAADTSSRPTTSVTTGPDSLRAAAERALKEGDFVGITAGLRTGDARQQARVGVGDLESGEAPPAEARYRIASTTKTFVSTVVLQLVGEGLLSLDDTVERWLPGLVQGNGNHGDRITIRNLLQNTSGLHNYTSQLALGDEESYEKDRYQERTPGELVQLALAQKPSFPPAEKGDPHPDWEYSNTNFVLAGMVIKAVTGQDWRTELKERIVRPLGLKDTYAPGRATDVRGPHSRLYHRFEDSTGWLDTTEFSPTMADSAGELISSNRDLDRFFTALLDGRLLGKAELREMRTTVPVSEDMNEEWPGTRYGLGLMKQPLSCGGTFWAHHGTVPGGSVKTAFTADGEIGLTLTATGLRNTEEEARRGDRATNELIDRTMCEAGE